MYEMPTEPASIGGVLDNGFKLFRACFNQVVAISILATFVSQIPSLFMVGSLEDGNLPELGGSLIIAVLLSLLLSVVFYGTIVARIHSVHQGVEQSFSESFTLGLNCMIPLLVCMLIYGFAVVLGSVLLIIPGIIVAISLLFAPYILVIERESIFNSLSRSHKLIWGYWWRIASLVSVAGFLVIVAAVLMSIVAGIFIAMDPESITSTSFSVTQAVSAAILGGLVTPLFYSLTMAAYYDLKLREEGDDPAARINA